MRNDAAHVGRRACGMACVGGRLMLRCPLSMCERLVIPPVDPRWGEPRSPAEDLSPAASFPLPRTQLVIRTSDVLLPSACSSPPSFLPSLLSSSPHFISSLLSFLLFSSPLLLSSLLFFPLLFPPIPSPPPPVNDVPKAEMGGRKGLGFVSSARKDYPIRVKAFLSSPFPPRWPGRTGREQPRAGQ